MGKDNLLVAPHELNHDQIVSSSVLVKIIHSVLNQHAHEINTLSMRDRDYNLNNLSMRMVLVKMNI